MSTNPKLLEELIPELKDIAENSCDSHATDELNSLISRNTGNPEFLDELVRVLSDIAVNTCDSHVTQGLQVQVRRITGYQLEERGLF